MTPAEWSDAEQAAAARAFCEAYLEAEDAWFNKVERRWRLADIRDEKLAYLLVVCGLSGCEERTVREVDPGGYL